MKTLVIGATFVAILATPGFAQTYGDVRDNSQGQRARAEAVPPTGPQAFMPGDPVAFAPGPAYFSDGNEGLATLSPGSTLYQADVNR